MHGRRCAFGTGDQILATSLLLASAGGAENYDPHTGSSGWAARHRGSEAPSKEGIPCWGHKPHTQQFQLGHWIQGIRVYDPRLSLHQQVGSWVLQPHTHRADNQLIMSPSLDSPGFSWRLRATCGPALIGGPTADSLGSNSPRAVQAGN